MNELSTKFRTECIHANAETIFFWRHPDKWYYRGIIGNGAADDVYGRYKNSRANFPVVLHPLYSRVPIHDAKWRAHDI